MISVPGEGVAMVQNLTFPTILEDVGPRAIHGRFHIVTINCSYLKNQVCS